MLDPNENYKPFKKHFWVPFSLALVILVAGIIMTLTNQTDLARYSGRGTGSNYTLTGPGVICLGTLLAGFMLYYKKYIK